MLKVLAMDKFRCSVGEITTCNRVNNRRINLQVLCWSAVAHVQMIAVINNTVLDIESTKPEASTTYYGFVCLALCVIYSWITRKNNRYLNDGTLKNNRYLNDGTLGCVGHGVGLRLLYDILRCTLDSLFLLLTLNRSNIDHIHIQFSCLSISSAISSNDITYMSEICL